MNEIFARRYRLLERIAIGGTAEVFRAAFLAGEGEGLPVVIKRILPQFARDERFRRLFHEEACVAVTMSHPNIVRVLDHGDIGPTCYIALELVEGKDLGSLLAMAKAAGRLPSHTVSAFITSQVAKALQFIHDQTSSEGTPLRIIHRDVSPQNILVSYHGDVKLTDFGIAKSIIRRERTIDGTLRGKLDYMAPEQAMLGDVDHRTDIFALGCVFFELLQGNPPFQSDSEIETLERVRTGRITLQPDRLSAPERLRQVLTRALEPKRELRYQRAEDMAADLNAFLSTESEGQGQLPEELGQWMKDLLAKPENLDGDKVEEAVRQLLGHDPDDQTSPRGITTVFASNPASTHSLSSTTRHETLSREHRRSPAIRLTYVLILMLAVAGWLLWVLQVIKPGPDASSTTRLSPTSDATRNMIPLTQKMDSQPVLSRRDLSATPAMVQQNINILSTPSRAIALVNGRSQGQTPLTVLMPSSPVTVELRKNGYRVWKRVVDPRRDGTKIQAMLQVLPSTSEPGFLTLNSWPWSRVNMDGKFVSNTPLLKWPVKVGVHQIELLAPNGTVRKSFTVVIRQGKISSYSFDLTQ